MPVVFRKQSSSKFRVPRSNTKPKTQKIDSSKKVLYPFKISTSKFQLRPLSNNQSPKLGFNTARNSPKRSQDTMLNLDHSFTMRKIKEIDRPILVLSKQ